jgi:hypothetical protein
VEFQSLADLRASDAEVLMVGGHFAGAYYLAGYAVECGLKACIAKAFKQDDIPDPRFVQAIYTHDLERLLAQSGLGRNIIPNSPVDSNWSIVEKWSEKSRYELSTTHTQASEMCKAVTHPTEGILPWLKRFW